MRSFIVCVTLVILLQPALSWGSDKTIPENKELIKTGNQSIQYKSDNEVTEFLAYKIIGITVFLLAAAFILLVIFKKYFPMHTLGMVQGKRIIICETRHLTRNTQVALISIDGSEYILASHGNSIAMLEHKLND